MKQGSENIHSKMTKERIRSAFLDMFNHASVETICVKELSQHAGISRATFYRHYSCVYDVLEDAMNYYLGYSSFRMHSIEDPDFDAIVHEDMVHLVERVKRYPKLFMQLYLDEKRFCHSNYVENISGRFDAYSEFVLREHAKERAESIIPTCYVAAMMSGSAAWILFRWIKDDFRETPQEIATIIIRASMAIVEAMLGVKQAPCVGS